LASESTRETRKTVTAVFADVVGSTPLQERIDVESAHHVMGRFYVTMRQALKTQGGHVAEFRGDAVVGLFGFPTVGEDDALRAVRAAAAMRDALAVLNGELERDWGVRIGMRVGVNTGEVVISPEGLAVGDAMNTAARLEQAAPAGEVLVAEATWRQVRHAVRGEPIEPLTVKGKRSPVAAFRLLDAPAGIQARARIEAPLIGRDGELGRLLAAFEQTVAAGSCRLVSVIGSPGLGKTRLAEELAAAVGEPATVLWGRCEPTGEGITFAPVAQVLRGVAGIGEADPEPKVRAKLAALAPNDPDTELLVERAAGILGLGTPAPAAETFWAVRRLLGALALARPLLVVLDDVQWGQPTFWELIEHLAEWGRHAPILLLVLARPELRELRPTLAKPGGLAHDVIELTPLSAEHSRGLVDELLDRAEVPPVLAARILTTAEGNPLFVGETVRMLIDDGVLRHGAAGWVVAADAALVDVPPTITALLAARIERLGAAERAVVEPASVIGKQFYRGAVAQLSPAPVAAGIDDHLAALQRKEVVEPEGTVWIDEPVFRFHHVLIRDAAYRGLLKEARAQLHERFADWLAAKVGELVGEHEEIIAFHLEQAHDYRRQLGPLDEHGQALAGRAGARLHSAGRRALAREDLPAATNLLTRAARLLNPDASELPDVLIDLLEVLLSAGETTEAATVLEQLRALAGSNERLSAWVVVAETQLAELTDTVRLHEALHELTAAAGALAAAGDDQGVAKAHHVRAHALALLGRVGEVETVLDQALAAARRAGDTRRVNAVLSGAPRAALWGPSPVIRASGRCLDVVRILRMSQGNRHVEARALRCQAVLEAMRGRTDAARQTLDRCRTTLEELGLGMELLETEQYAGIVELIADDHAAAERRLRAAHDGFAARQLGVANAAAAALLARALLAQGRDGEAEELTLFSEVHAGEHLETTIAWCGVRAQALARRGEYQQAERFARRAVDLAAATDALVDHGDARMALAAVLRAAGHEPEAAAQARRAVALYRAKGYELGAARASEFAGGAPRRFDAPPTRDPGGMRGTPIDQLGQRIAMAFNQRDWPALRACVTDDLICIDRRPASPRGDSHGAAAFLDLIRTYVEISQDAQMACTQLVEAGDVYLTHVTMSGHETESGSEFIIPFLLVGHIVNGRIERLEYCDPDHERSALHRLLELQPDLAVRAAWRHQLDVVAAVNAGDQDTLARLGHSGLLDLLQPGGRMNVELLDTAGDAAVMSRLHLLRADGEPARVLGHVAALRDGVATHVELFSADDEAGMRACFAHATPPAPLGPAGRLFARIAECFNARDIEGAERYLSGDFFMTDHRPVSPLGADLPGRQAFFDRVRALIAVASDVRIVTKPLGEIGEVAIYRNAWVGHQDDTGGAFEIAFRNVIQARGTELVRIEVYAPDDDVETLRGLCRLVGSAPTSPVDAEAEPATRMVLRAAEAVNQRAWSELAASVAADLTIVDHRRVASLDGVGSLGAARSLVGAASDLVVWTQPLAELGGVAMVRATCSGHLDKDGGAFQIVARAVVEVGDGRITGCELFDDDEVGMLAALARRHASRSGPAGLARLANKRA
jgi:class 3 adenylate cyclase/tetratricopeptide (TPR) repeat protein